MAEVAYCMKCKKKTEMVKTEEVTMKNGRKALKGKCSVCGTGMYKILGKQLRVNKTALSSAVLLFFSLNSEIYSLESI